MQLPETKGTKPQQPKKWKNLETATASYGHGIAVSPVHLATAYSILVNGGVKINPSIINGSRKRRIASGSGSEIQDVNRLLKQFKNMQLMMKKISKHGADGMEKMLTNNMSTNNFGNMLNNLRRK